MQRRLSRSQLRRQREYRQAIDLTERELDYDAVIRMDEIDRMPRTYRELVNEHGYVAVKQCLMETREINQIRRMLAQRHDSRQQQLANGWF